MTTDLSLQSLLPVVSAAIAIGGLAVRLFVPTGPAKQTLIAAAFIFLLLTSSLLWNEQRNERQQIRRAADEIVDIIGNNKRTYGDILADLRSPNSRLAAQAIDLLIDENRIGSEPATITDRPDTPVRVRWYFVRTFSRDMQGSCWHDTLGGAPNTYQASVVKRTRRSGHGGGGPGA